jgi:hypothetical protein
MLRVDEAVVLTIVSSMLRTSLDGVARAGGVAANDMR